MQSGDQTHDWLQLTVCWARLQTPSIKSPQRLWTSSHWYLARKLYSRCQKVKLEIKVKQWRQRDGICSPLPQCTGIYKKSPKTVTSYGGQHLFGQGLTSCHQGLSLCPCFFIPSLIHLASPRDAHLATRPPYYPMGTIFLLSALFLYSSSVYRLLHFLVPAALAYFRNAPPHEKKRVH